MAIDRNSHLPLYIQLKETLLAGLLNGAWKSGEKLPTEEEIQQKYDLSRTTVRQALRELELEGRITRQAGRGTFVTQPKIQEGTESFVVDLTDLAQKGLQMSWKVLSAGDVPAPETVARHLQTVPDAPLFQLRRLRFANEDPIAYAVSYLTADYAANADLDLALQGGTMGYIRGLELDHCIVDRVVEALPAERDEAAMLEIERGAPVLVLTRLLRGPDSRPIEFYRGVYRGDRFQYHIQSMPPQV